GADINAVKGWEITTGSGDVIIGVLDSGVKLNHPDLSDRIWINTKETKNGKDDDGNGYTDDIYGWNFAYENSNVNDDGGHGTNIGGTIGASTNNSIGYAGLDQKCKLMICKNLDNDNLGEYSWWATSLYYASNNGAKVINMSEGGYDYSKTLQTAIDYAHTLGSLIVASMMNKNNGDNYYPASLKNVLAVGATDTDDSRCKQFTWGGGSNWGKHIAVVAPGNRIYGLDYRNNNDYNVYWSGTSQATAYVTGIASLLLSQSLNRTNSDLKEIIVSTAKDQVGDSREDKPGWDEYHGFGRVDVYEALNFDNTAGRTKEDKPKEEGTNKDKENKEKEDFGKAKAVDRNAKDKDNDSEDRRAKKVDR
ncbi:MAG: S8 family serine peptidase, partial [Ignavibacteria bacterium]